MQQDCRRLRARAEARRQDSVMPWWAWALLAGGLIAAMPTFAQTDASPGAGTLSPVPGVQGPAEGAAPTGQVPEVVKPLGSATLPPGNDSGTGGVPLSENPQVGGGRAIPDSGVIVPPVNGTVATTPVIRPPSTGTTPVIPPPGSPGGERGVVPK